MTIYSWNILYRNKRLDEVFEFISHTEFDIFCLQEVPGEFLTRLKNLPYSVAFRIDVERLFTGRPVQNYVVILSKHPIEAQGEIPFPDYWMLLPLLTRFFVRLARPLGFSKMRNRGGVFADIRVSGSAAPTRVFNLHLILANPVWRLKEFELAMAERDVARPTIVCGDFNTLEKPHITLLNWILGGRIMDTLLYKRERTHIEKRFVEHELQNALSGSVTHPVSRSQLDHILVSHSFSIQKAEVLPDRMGSDHHAIRAEVV
jgi:endonuclease/exonuclease/phosphatase family metal-dependent hydrolase